MVTGHGEPRLDRTISTDGARNLLLDRHQAITRIAVVAAKLHGAGNVRVHHDTKANDCLVVTDACVQSARLNHDLPSCLSVDVMEWQATLRHKRVYQ